jgi:hypothetical protein
MNRTIEIVDDPRQDLNRSLSEGYGLVVSLKVLGIDVMQQMRLIAILAVTICVLAILLLASQRFPVGHWVILRESAPELALVLLFGLTSALVQLFRLRACRESVEFASAALYDELRAAEQVACEEGAW